MNIDNLSEKELLRLLVNKITSLEAGQHLLNTRLDHLESEIQILKEGFSEITESFLVTNYVDAFKKKEVEI